MALLEVENVRRSFGGLVPAFSRVSMVSCAGLLVGDDLYSPDNSDMIPYLDNSLRDEVLYHLDKEYMVEKGQVIIVDEFTGRLMPGRRYSDGLQQPIEAKEKVEIKRESKTLATVTLQNYFRLFKKLAGMTGTAKTEEEEFMQIYGLETIVRSRDRAPPSIQL